MRVGFIGLGIMGAPMARNLLKEGHEVTVWARRAEKMQVLLDDGAMGVDSPADLASCSDVVISMVADAPDVREVMLGEQGVGRSAKPGLIAVDMSTIAPQAAREIAEALKLRGIDFLDAPVSGGETGAITGSLSIMVGGSVVAFNAIKPVFSCMGRSVVHVGASGAGQVTKAANQILTGVGVLALAEAFNFAQQNGVDLVKVREALLGGSARSTILENHGQRMLDRNFKPGFKSWMHQKDMNIVMQTGCSLGLWLPATFWKVLRSKGKLRCGMDEEDSVAMLKLVEQISGAAH